MAPSVLHRICHGTTTPTPLQKALLAVSPALLPLYRRHKVLHCDYPAMLPCSAPTASVRGTYVSGLTAGDLWRLDIFEGEEYERRKVRVRVLDGDGTGEGREEEAEAYVWVAGEQNLEDAEWDFEHFCREKIGKWVGGSGNADVQGESAVRASILGLLPISRGREGVEG